MITRITVRHRSSVNAPRRGAMAVFGLLLMSVFVVIAAMGVELGMFMAEKSEMQRAVDASALAACWEYTAHLARDVDEPQARTLGRNEASAVINENLVRYNSLVVDLNNQNTEDGDIVFGDYSEFGNPYGEIAATDSGVANAIKITLQQTQTRNGEVLFTLGRLLGINSKPLTVEATAAIARHIRGFKAPDDASANVDMLPFAVKREIWNALMAGNGTDDYTWNYDTQTVTNGGDGVLEFNLYPHTTGSAGNSGTVDIGSNNNSTADIVRQVLYGVSASDLAFHGGRLELNANGELLLNGDTGISAGMKDELEAIKGRPRSIFVYSQVTGNGNNATFTIVKFVGIRIMYVNFQGSRNSSKKLIVQPATVISEYVIVSNSGDDTSALVFSPARIVK